MSKAVNETSSFLFLVAVPGDTSSFLLLVTMLFSSVLAPSE